MVSPKVSIIIPTYNRTQLLERSINSLLKQTYKNFEVIVSLDGSPKETEEIAKNYQKIDPRIKYVYNKRFGSTARPFNKALEIAQGELIALQGDDDEWLPKKLEKQVSLLMSDEKLAMVFCGVYRIGEDATIKKDIFSPPHTLQRLLNKNYPITPTVLIKKNVLEKTGLFDESLKYSDDWDMWIRIAKNHSFDFVPEALCKYYVHNTSLSSSAKEIDMAKEFVKMIEKHHEIYQRHPDSLSYIYSKIAKKFHSGRNNNMAKKYLHKNFILRKDIKSGLRLLLSYINIFPS